MIVLKLIFIFVVNCFPWSLRRLLYNYFFSWNLNKKSYIGFSFLLVDSVVMEENSRIGHLNIFKGLASVKLSCNSRVGSLNYFTAFPQNGVGFFCHQPERKPIFKLGKESAVTSRHYLDCTAGIEIGSFSTFAGIRSTVLTHSIDLKLNRQHSSPVLIGDYCFIGTNVVILPNSTVPSLCVVGSGTVFRGHFQENRTIFFGNPVQFKPIDNSQSHAYFDRIKGFVN